MSKGTAGYGSKLYYSLDQQNYVPMAQLQKFEPAGSKQAMVDQTNLSTPGNFTQPKAIQVDGGEIDLAGVYSGDPTQFLMGELHGSLKRVYWLVILSDGTQYSFVAFVSEYKPWDVVYNKFIPFSGKLRLVGGMFGPLSTFDAGAFDPSAFQTALI